GVALAGELAARGAQVHLVLGPSPLTIERPGITVRQVTSAAEMYDACLNEFPGIDIAILSAAVADYMPAEPSPETIKNSDHTLNLQLKPTQDILKALGAAKKQGQLLVGFALASTDGRQAALTKLQAKNADLIVLNSLRDEGAGFGLDTNKITIFGKDGFERSYEKKPKQQVARDIVDTVVNRFYA